MFLREVKRQNKNGSHVSYLQLVHNEWDPAAQTSRTKIVHSFGRTDQVDPAAIERLIASLQRLREPFAAPGTSASSASSVTNGGAELSLLAARPMGGTHLLDGMWHRLGIDAVMTTLLAVQRRDPRTERALFALVANRALNASSKLAAANWVSHDVHIDECWSRHRAAASCPVKAVRSDSDGRFRSRDLSGRAARAPCGD
jgi:hypothetical protein